MREEIARIAPREIIAPKARYALAALLESVDCPVTWLDGAGFAAGRARKALATRGFRRAEAAGALARRSVAAAGAALRLCRGKFRTRPGPSAAAASLSRRRVHAGRRGQPASSGTGALRPTARAGSLLSVLDETLTPVGARALQNWIVYPLLDLDAICARHDAVEELFETDLGGDVADALRRIGDLERLAGRIGSLRASPRDCLKLEQALRAVGDAARCPPAMPQRAHPRYCGAADAAARDGRAYRRDDQRRAAGESARREYDSKRASAPRSTSCARSPPTRAA